MSVKYRLIQENRKEAKYKGCYYGLCVPTGVVDIRQLSKKISGMCTVTLPDVLAVISALVIQMKYYLQDGKKIVLDDFGSFRVGMRSSPSQTIRGFTKKNIKELRIIFHPVTHMVDNHKAKDFFEGVKVEKMG